MKANPVFLILTMSIWVTISAASADAQTYTRSAAIARNSGDLHAYGGSGNKKRIFMRVWVERVSRNDGTETLLLNYKVRAEDQNMWGNWKLANALYNLTYSIQYAPASTPWQVVTRTGTISLNNLPGSEGILYDASGTGQMMVVGLSATAQRYGGSSGISVSY